MSYTVDRYTGSRYQCEDSANDAYTNALAFLTAAELSASPAPALRLARIGPYTAACVYGPSLLIQIMRTDCTRSTKRCALSARMRRLASMFTLLTISVVRAAHDPR